MHALSCCDNLVIAACGYIFFHCNAAQMLLNHLPTLHGSTDLKSNSFNVGFLISLYGGCCAFRQKAEGAIVDVCGQDQVQESQEEEDEGNGAEFNVAGHAG